MGQYIAGPPISGLTPQQVQDQLSVATRNDLNEIYPTQTGQTSSYVTGDDGGLKTTNGRLVDFFTLQTNNIFGNTNRFTNDKGGSIYDGSGSSTANYGIDHATGLGWYNVLQVNDTWANVISAANSFTLSPYNTGWRLPNFNQLCTILNDQNTALTSLTNYPPFNLNAGGGSWTSTTYFTATTKAIAVTFTTGAGTTNWITYTTKTIGTSFGAYYCRKHF